MPAPSCYLPSRRKARPDFVLSRYVLAGNERVVVLPGQGPCAGVDGRPCRIRPFSRRGRKTGPRHALTIARCMVHGRHFTVYPPGFAPYQRASLVAEQGPEGGPERSPEADDLSDFRPSWFDAAIDAGLGRAWPRANEKPPRRWWRTQCRHCDRGARLLGLATELEDGVVVQIAEVLGLPALLPIEERTRLGASSGYRGRGESIVRMLRLVPRRASLGRRLAACGYLAGLWGRPREWSASKLRLVDPPF